MSHWFVHLSLDGSCKGCQIYLNEKFWPYMPINLPKVANFLQYFFIFLQFSIFKWSGKNSSLSCADKTNAEYSQKHAFNACNHRTPRNCRRNYLGVFWNQKTTKNCSEFRKIAKQMCLRWNFWWVFWHLWNRFFILVNLIPTPWESVWLLSHMHGRRGKIVIFSPV